MAGKPEAPHGTESAFKRHKRRGETPCQRCQDAHDVAKASRRSVYRQARVESASGAPAAPQPVSPSPRAAAPVTAEDSEHVRDLKATRDILMEAIESLRRSEPWKIPGLSKELRETWREIVSLSAEEKREEDAFSEFFDDDGTSSVTRLPHAEDRAAS